MAPPYDYDSGPEVVTKHEQQLPEAVPNSNGRDDEYMYQQQQQHAPAWAPQNETHGRSRRGFALMPFLLGLAIGAVVIGAALGGGLGANLASCNSDKNDLQTQSSSGSGTISANSTTINPSTNLGNYTVASAAQVQQLYLNCPTVGGQTYTTRDSFRFSTHCSVDYPPGTPASNGYTISHLQGLTMYTWQDCIEACGSYNEQIATYGGDKTCGAVSFSAQMSNITAQIGANCWLKNATVAQGVTGNTANHSISAVLQT